MLVILKLWGLETGRASSVKRKKREEWCCLRFVVTVCRRLSEQTHAHIDAVSFVWSDNNCYMRKRKLREKKTSPFPFSSSQNSSIWHRSRSSISSIRIFSSSSSSCSVWLLAKRTRKKTKQWVELCPRETSLKFTLACCCHHFVSLDSWQTNWEKGEISAPFKQTISNWLLCSISFFFLF